MAYQENMSSAAARHFADAELLANSTQGLGACQLIGYAAECALKHLLESQFNVRNIHKQGSGAGHFPRLTAAARISLAGRSAGPVLALLNTPGFMHHWDIDLRYTDDASLQTVAGNTAPHFYANWKADAVRIFQLARLTV
jgi:hypothetical protein